MSNIRLSRSELLQQAKKIRILKEEIDRILRQTGSTYSLLNGIWEVSTGSVRSQLDNVRSATKKSSRDFERLCENLYNAAKIYELKEAELNRLAGIKEQPIRSGVFLGMLATITKLESTKNLPVNKISLGNMFSSITNILSVDLDELKRMIGVAREVSIGNVFGILNINSSFQKSNIKDSNFMYYLGDKFELFYEEFKETEIGDAVFNEVKGAILSYNPRDFLKVKYFNDFGFKFVKNDGKIFIRSTSKNFINSNRDFQVLKGEFTENLGGTWKWRKPYLESLVNGDGESLI